MLDAIARRVLDAIARRVAAQADDAPRHIIVRGSDYVSPEKARDGLPIPPRSLWGSGAPTIDAYLDQGLDHYQGMRSILDRNGLVAAGAKILDFGCGAGRTLRMWGNAPGAELWGCDINGEQIRWCRANLQPFRFFQSTVVPHLPIEDNTFDLIYAGSVFTHISDLIDHWLLELRRVIRQGGLLFATIHDENTWRLVKAGRGTALEPALHSHPEGAKPALDADFVSFGLGPASNTFFRRDYFAALAGQFFDVLEVAPEARGYQTAFMLRKPSAPA
jgi:SAM-dependent methyltransferase